MKRVVWVLWLALAMCFLAGCDGEEPTIIAPWRPDLSGVRVAIDPSPGAYAGETAEAVAHLLNLLQGYGVRVVDPASVRRVLASYGYLSFDVVSPEKAREIAAGLGVDYVLALSIDSFSQTGSQGSVEMPGGWVESYTSRVVGRATVRCTSLDTMELVLARTYPIDVSETGVTGAPLKPEMGEQSSMEKILTQAMMANPSDIALKARTAAINYGPECFVTSLAGLLHASPSRSSASASPEPPRPTPTAPTGDAWTAGVKCTSLESFRHTGRSLTADRSGKEFGARFPRSTTARVGWWAGLEYPAPGRARSLAVHWVLYRASGAVDYDYTSTCEVAAGETGRTYGASCGYDEVGQWVVGIYRYVLYVEGREIANGLFEIY